MEQKLMSKQEEQLIEKMAQDIIKLIKKKKLWNTDCGLIYGGKHVQSTGEKEKHENLAGVMRIWYEGPLARVMDNDDKFWTQLEEVMAKYGYYPVPYSYVDLNVYPL